MNYLKTIFVQMEDLTGIKDIFGASEEIASMKMRGIRTKVLLSRDMNAELTEIYLEVKTSYKNQLILLTQEKGGKKVTNSANAEDITLKSGNGKGACVFLSANSGLFSNILEKTFQEFTEYLDKHKEADPIVIGEFGKTLFKNHYPGRVFIFYSLAEGKATEDSLRRVTQDLSSYSNVVIYYARFETMAHQTSTILDVSGEEDSTPQTPVTMAHYLFEPSLEKIITFFESEIFAGIIQQTVTESELAQYASRITTLDMARENINRQLKIINLQKRFAMHRLMNKKQTEALTGISLWKVR